MSVKFELPLNAIEPLYTALHNIKPMENSRLEMKAVSLLRTALQFELEKMLETPEEKEERQLNFKTLFNEERRKRMEREQERAY